MAVYYKFKSAKDFDSINIEGQFISVGTLKERIFDSKHLGRGTDFDLMVSNAQTNEEYVDEATMIPRNTSVLIKRVPGCPRKNLVTHDEPEPGFIENKVEELPPTSGMMGGDSSTMKYPEESDWDEFGNDLYAMPEVIPVQSVNPVTDVTPESKIDEENKLKALIETPALDWNMQGQDSYGGGRGFGRGMGRMMGGRGGFGRGGGGGGGYERKNPPAGYICHRCKVPGHFIQHCPTNGDPTFDIRRVKPPTGIPKSMLMATPDGSYALPSGGAAVLRPNEAAFEKEIEGLPSTRSVTDLPPELHCPLCKEVMKDAVLTSKCCFSSFCDKCIRDHIITKSMCVCGATNVLADDLLPNKTLRQTIGRILESTTSSAENGGSMVQVQDMESHRHVPPRVPSPTLSVASKDEPRRPPIECFPDAKVNEMKEENGASEGKADNAHTQSLDKKAVKNADASGATPESMSRKEPISPESAPVPEDVQEKSLGGEQGKKKKKKKTRLPGSAADMQWRNFQDLGAENYGGMPLAPSAYNPYWGGGVPMGMDGYMAPFGGPMPYMGYAPTPFDVPFGGMMPQDPFAAQGYMMPLVPPRDLSELGMNSMGMNQGQQVMSREQFEARKAEARRKREIELLNERDRSRGDVRGGMSREVSSSVAPDGSTMKAKPRMMSQTDRFERSDRFEHPDRFERAERFERQERFERSEKPANMDRHAAARELARHSPPPRPAKRRSSDHDDTSAAAAAAAEQAAQDDKKAKKSVFSRISFPESLAEGGSKKRKTTTSSSTEVVANGGGSSKDHHHHHHHHRRESPHRSSSAAVSNGYRRSSYGSSDEEEEEYHFKRKPSSRRGEEREEVESSRPSRASRMEREHRGHERVESKRR